MNVYIESNFVLTLALQQEGHHAAARILDLGQAGLISLRIPSFSLSEPFSTITYRGNNRNRLLNTLREEIRELGRTQPYRRMADQLGQHAIQMSGVRQTEMEAVARVTFGVAKVCEIIQIDSTILSKAETYRLSYDMTPQDAIVLASVVVDLLQADQGTASLFISRNAKDFGHPAVQEELQSLGSRYLADFSNGVRFIGWSIQGGHA